MGSQAERVRGVRRWTQWLNRHLSSHGIVREPAVGPEPYGALWHVRFSTGPTTRIHVTESALTVTEESFEELVAQADETDWIKLLRTADGGVRINGDGRVEEMQETGE